MKGWIIPICIVCLLLTGASQIELGYAQQNTNPQQEHVSPNSDDQSAEKDPTQLGSIRTFWKLTEKGGQIRWAIFAVLFLGIFVIVMKIIELILDRTKSKKLAMADFRGLSFAELKALVDSQPESLFSKLFYMMIKVFSTTKSAEGFREEIGSYLQLQQDSFNTFKARMAFLSDTAGALGLLGTVWGIFVTFFGGNVDNQLILSGMGIALITTLMGLVVSIILNLCATEIFSFFNKRMDLLASKGDEFRLRLMEIQQESQPVETIYEAQPMMEDFAATPKVQKELQPTTTTEGSEDNKPVELRILDGNGQTSRVMTKLRKPLLVSVIGKGGSKLKGIPVRFEVNDNSGKLNGEFSVTEQKTDNQGKTSISWTLGPKTGKQRVTVSTDGIERETFIADAIAAPPTLLRIIQGNHQSANINQELTEPFSVALFDQFENHVADHEVTFEVSMGNGHLSGGKRKITTRTDANGQISVKLELGPTPGFNSVKVSAKDLKETIEFQAMAQ